MLKNICCNLIKLTYTLYKEKHFLCFIEVLPNSIVFYQVFFCKQNIGS